MKKTIVLTAVLLAFVFAPLWAQNQDLFEVKQNADGGITITNFKSHSWSGREFVIPSTLYGLPVTRIDDYAFGDFFGASDRAGMLMYSSVVIPDTVTSIGKGAFAGQGLSSVTLGKNVRTIGENAFSGNWRIKKIIIPNSVTEIGEGAFRGTIITEVILPPSVRKVGKSAFLANGASWYDTPRRRFSAVQGEVMTVVIPASLSPGTYGQFGSKDEGVFARLNTAFGCTFEENKDSNVSITLPAGMDTDIVKANFGESLAGYYASQGKTAGTYIKNGPIWVKGSPGQKPKNPPRVEAGSVIFKEGKELFDKGEYDDAIRLFNDALWCNPNDSNSATYLKNAQEKLQQAAAQQQTQQNVNTAKKYFDSGQAALNKNEYDKAIADYTEAVRLDPNNNTYKEALRIAQERDQASNRSVSAFHYGIRGEDAYDKKDYDKAIADFTEAIRLSPNPSNYYFKRAKVYMAKKDYDKAIADYTEAIRLNPKNTDAYRFRAHAYKAKGDYDKAIADYTEIINQYNSSYHYLSDRADTYFKKGDYINAIADYTEAIRLNPNYKYFYSDRAKAYIAKKDYVKAITDYTEAIRLEPKDKYAYINRAEAYIAKKDYDKAIADCNEAIRLDPNSPSAYSTRAKAYIGKRNYKEARADVNEALRINPNYQPAINLDAELTKKGYPSALSQQQSQTAQQPKQQNQPQNARSAQSYFDSGKVAYENKDYNKAITDFTEAIRLDPNFIAYLYRGFTYNAKGDYDKAIADFTQAIRIDPNDKYSYFNRAYSYVCKGNYDKAIIDYTQVIRIDPNYTYAYFDRGNAYFVKRDYDKAIADYTLATKLDPNNANYKQGLEIIQRRGKPSATFPKGFEGTWKRDNFNNTLTFTTNTLKSSSQNYSWILSGSSGDTYTYYPDNNPSYSFTPTIKLVNGNLVISGDSGDGEDNWNGTWKKQKK